jgi:3-oxoacyl-[acyl-carrier protein] reductase
VPDLSNHVALITGGSRGIGRATALRFAQAGARIVIADVADDAGNETIALLTDQGAEARYVHADVSDRASTDALAEAALEAFGQIDILVNNAGITRDSTLKKMSGEDFDRVLDVNLKGVFNTTKSVLPAMLEAAYGRILNAASVVGLYGNFGQTNYVASKAGVIGMTKTWARELGRKGITVNAVAPGFIATEMVESVPDNVIDQLKARTPLGRLGEAADIANAYCFLASEEASFITGTVLSVDGGLVL